MYSWSWTRSSSASFGWLLMRCSRTRSRSRTAMILRKKSSIGMVFSCVPARPGLRTRWPPVQRSAMWPETDCSAFRTARTACTIFRRSSSSSMARPARRSSSELLLRDVAQAGPGCVHQARHVPVRVSVLVHQLVDVGNLLEGERLRQARVDLPGRDEVVQRARLVVVREVRPLETLLAHPQVAEIGDRVVARRSGADDDHAPGVAHEDRRRHGVLTRVLEDEPRVLALAEDLPERGAERARALQPFGVPGGVLPVRQHAPVRELLAVDATLGAEPPA